MRNRSANATIKGYFYQFDHTILQILQASSSDASVVIEGIEDVDIEDGNDSVLVQCKYYEGTEYNHSVIKRAVIQMLRHYHKAGCSEQQQLRYRIYGHYKAGQHKLKQAFDLDFLKENFLTYKDKDETQQLEHKNLGVTDVQLTHFQKLLEINVTAPSYEEQQSQVITLLKKQIPCSQNEDVEAFYYPNTINVIQGLAIKREIKDRKITKKDFFNSVNKKEVVFSLWLRQKFGDDHYAKSIKRKHFKFDSTKVPSATRIFVIDATGGFDTTQISSLLSILGKKLSHTEHRLTPPEDRFCPYVILRDLSAEDLVKLKKQLFANGVKFEDGYPFNGADFHPALLANAPTKEYLIQLKFIPDTTQIKPVVAAITGSSIEIFDFFKSTSLGVDHIPNGVQHHAIKVPSAEFINKVLI